jgi:hypothetical protein
MAMFHNHANEHQWKYGGSYQQYPTNQQYPVKIRDVPMFSHYPAFWSPFQRGISPYATRNLLTNDPNSYYAEFQSKLKLYENQHVAPEQCLQNMGSVAKWETGTYFRSKM